MPVSHTIDSMRQYKEVVDLVQARGTRRSPRGRLTYDTGHTTITLTDPTQGLAVGVGRGLSPRVAAVEAVQLVGAFHDARLMVWASPNFKEFRDEGTDWFWGAYGMRVGTQVNKCWHKLKVDPSTRQAVVTLWNPALDNEDGHRDYPCTVGLGFTLTPANRLDLHVVMRSNDVWLGFPYDVFQFTQLQLTMARALNADVGQYVHTAWSMHLYDENLGQLNDLHDGQTLGSAPYQPQGFGRDGDTPTWARAEMRAWRVGRGERVNFPLSDSEEWYVQQLSAYKTYLG